MFSYQVSFFFLFNLIRHFLWRHIGSPPKDNFFLFFVSKNNNSPPEKVRGNPGTRGTGEDVHSGMLTCSLQ